MPKFFKTCCAFIPQRFIICALCSGALIVCFLQRMIYFQGMNDMVYSKMPDDKTSVSTCPLMTSNQQSHATADLYWEFEMVRAVTQAFYVGFLVVSIPAGLWVDIYGGKGILGLGVLLTSISTALMPIMTKDGPIPLVFLRFFQGIAQGMVFPSVIGMTTRWAPITERATIASIVTAGQFIGWGLGYGIHLVTKMHTDSWNVQFYLAFIIGLFWLFFWFIFAYSTPDSNPYISQAELTLIYNHSKSLNRQNLLRLYVPWKAILSSPPVLSLLLVNWAHSWIHYTLMHQLDGYLIHVLKMTVHLSRMTSLLADVTVAPSTIFWGILCDWLVNNKYMTRTANRKTFVFSSHIILVPFLIGISFAKCNGMVVTGLYVALCYFRGPFESIHLTNPIDLSPEHAGLLLALMNSTSAVSALFSWEIVSAICDVPSDIDKWRVLFLISVAVLVILSLPYLWFGSAEIQPWNWWNDAIRLRDLRRQTTMPTRQLMTL